MKRLTLLAAVLLVGCNMTQLAVGTQAEVMELAYPSIEEQTDYEFARTGIPGNLIQLEGLLAVQPDNERLLLMASQGFASYAYGFIEEDWQQAELVGDLELADHHRARARVMYLKARDYGLRLLRLLESDFPEQLPRDPDALEKILDSEFGDAEHAAALFWTGNAWGSAINVSRDDPALVADLPFSKVLVERSVELDERYYHAAGHVFLGVANASLGESMGGKPEQGRQHFEKALALTGGKAGLVHVNYAQAYAVHKQDKQLFTKLLERALELPATGRLALPNTIAQRRARRLLSQVDTLILGSLDDLPPTPEPAPEPGSEPEPAAPSPPAPQPESTPPQEPAPEPAKPTNAR